nr:hypothetical protein [Tanacetum cinerariifolium]
MDNTRAQQKALDDELVSPTNCLKIGKSNLRLSSNIKSKESTLQVALDALKLTPFYNAFEIFADAIPRRNKMFWHYARDDFMFTTVRLISKHQDIQVYGAILPQHLTNQAMLESKAYMTYRTYATGEKTQKLKSIKKKADSESSPKTKPTQASKGIRIKASAKRNLQEKQERISQLSRKWLSQEEDEEENDEHDSEDDNDDHENANDNDDEDDDQENVNDQEEKDEEEKQMMMIKCLLIKRVSSFESELSEPKQTNQFVKVVSFILGIVDNYLGFKMKDAVNVAVQLQLNKLREEAYADNDEFLKQIDLNIKSIIKDQTKMKNPLLDQTEERSDRDQARNSHQKKQLKGVQVYKFFQRIRHQDIEDMLLLLVQEKLTNLNLDEWFTLNVALRMYTKRIVIQERVEDLQLAGIIHQDDMNRNQLMRTDELYKFSDGILNHVRIALNDIATGIQMEYLPKRK